VTLSEADKRTRRFARYAERATSAVRHAALAEDAARADAPRGSASATAPTLVPDQSMKGGENAPTSPQLHQ